MTVYRGWRRALRRAYAFVDAPDFMLDSSEPVVDLSRLAKAIAPEVESDVSAWAQVVLRASVWRAMQGGTPVEQLREVAALLEATVDVADEKAVLEGLAQVADRVPTSGQADPGWSFLAQLQAGLSYLSYPTESALVACLQAYEAGSPRPVHRAGVQSEVWAAWVDLFLAPQHGMGLHKTVVAAENALSTVVPVPRGVGFEAGFVEVGDCPIVVSAVHIASQQLYPPVLRLQEPEKVGRALVCRLDADPGYSAPLVVELLCERAVLRELLAREYEGYVDTVEYVMGDHRWRHDVRPKT